MSPRELLLLGAIRSHFQRHPQVRLSVPQASRVWQTDQATCRTLLQHLVRERFLRVNETGKYSLAATDRRRASRATPGPLRVKAREGGDGVLINISEGGALVQLSSPAPLNARIVVEVAWEHTTLLLHGRVVRSNPAAASAGSDGTDYYVAVAFGSLGESVEGSLRELLRA
jgi:DNA-binding IclR family transcriptional regulator